MSTSGRDQFHICGPHSEHEPLVGVEVLRRVYLEAAHGHLAEAPARAPAMRLVRAFRGISSWIDLPQVGGRRCAVIGSHDTCDLVLSGDDRIAHRHLAAVWVRLFEDDPDTQVLRLIDLRTGAPFFLHDGRPRRTVDAPFAVRVGESVVCAVPIAPEAAERGEQDAAARASQTPAPRDGGNEPRHIRMILDGRDESAVADLSIEAFDEGVVLGRGRNGDYLDAGFRRVLSDKAISGAHLLLLREWDGLLAVDLRSTNGTRIGGRRIHVHRITEDVTLELGTRVALRLAILKGEG